MTLPSDLASRGLVAHPEGGWFRETWRSTLCTVIDFALESGTFSAWHRVRGADEVWTYVRGCPLRLHVIHPDGRYETLVLNDERSSAVVPADAWQAAEPVGTAAPYVLVTCTVSPPFAFDRFDLADATLARSFPNHAPVIDRFLPG
ncbi:MAG: cupin domain-containing protein [Myxococcota bacterium]